MANPTKPPTNKDYLGMQVFSPLTFKVFPFAAAGFLSEITSESDSSLLLSNRAALPRFPFFAAFFFGNIASGLSSPVEPLDDTGFFVVAGFFAAVAVLLALAGCFLVALTGAPSSEDSFAC